tara:strand:- start:872 stop:991 length:120 start_codon:yes stop_codon:yes gene_type:complete
MIKKTIILIFLLVLAVSCGKKGDPEYKVFKNKNSLIQII